MKFCYLDESGTGDEPFAVMVGILVDHTRMKPTKEDWQDLLNQLSATTGKHIQEIHTHELYAGNSPFRGLDGNARTAIINQIFQWLQVRKHYVVFTAVDKANYFANAPAEAFNADIGSLWRHMAFHITLALQKNLQVQEKNKGNCVLIFDNKVHDQTAFTNLILNPPAWSDTYYTKGKKQNRLDQIVDVPHFVDSKQVGLIQLADFLCYFLRKHIELQSGAKLERYQGETPIIADYFKLITQMSIPKAHTFLSKARCPAANYFYNFAPTIIR